MSTKSLGQLTLDMILKTGSYTEPLNKAARQTKQSMQEIEKTATQTSQVVQRSFATLGIGISINELRKYSDSWTDLNSRVNLAVGPMGDANKVMGEIEQIARKTYSSLEGTAEGYLLNASALTELGYSTQQQLQFTNALAAGLVASGAKQERAASVTNALTKAIAEGVLRGDNWNTVYQTGGEVADALARGLGVSRQELDKLARSGQLTADKVVPALIGQLDDLQGKADSMATTVGDAFVQLDNAALRVFGGLAEGTNATGLVSASILKLADNLEIVVDIAAIAGAVMVGRLGAATLANITQFRIASKEAMLYQMRLASMSGVSAGTAKNLLRLDAVTKSLNRTLSIVGGPAGLIFTAATALTYFAFTGGKADESAAKLNEQLDILNLNYKNLTQKQAALAKLQANDKLAENTEKLANAQEKLRLQKAQLQKAEAMDPRYKNVQAQAIDGLNKRIIESEALIEQLTITQGQYKQSLEQINGVINKTPAEIVAPKLSEEFEKQAEAMTRRIALFGKVGEAEKLLYEIQSGSLAGKLSETEQNALLALARKEDLLYQNAEAAKALTEEQQKAADSVLAFVNNARETQTALQSQIDGTDKLSRSKQALISYEAMLAEIRTKKTLTSLDKEHLAQEAATRAQLEKNVALEEEARIRAGLTSLFSELQTDEEKRFETFKERMKLLDDAKKLTSTVDVEMVQRVSGDLFEDSPMSARLDVTVSGPAGELERIAEEEAVLNDWYQRQTEMLNQARLQQFDTNIDWNAQELALKEQHETAMSQIETQKRGAQLAIMGDFFSSLASMQNSESKKARQVAKAAAVAQALINTYQSATAAYAAMAPIPFVGPALGVAAAAAAIMAGMANVNAIRGQAHSGLDYIPSEGTWILDKGERVLSPRQNEDLTQFLSAVNNDAGIASSGVSAGFSGTQPIIQFNLASPNQESMMELIMANRGALAGMVASAFEDQGIRLA